MYHVDIWRLDLGWQKPGLNMYFSKLSHSLREDKDNISAEKYLKEVKPWTQQC